MFFQNWVNKRRDVVVTVHVVLVVVVVVDSRNLPLKFGQKLFINI